MRDMITTYNPLNESKTQTRNSALAKLHNLTQVEAVVPKKRTVKQGALEPLN